jgi:MFS family permease
MTNSYGVFQEYYSTHQLAGQSATAISWIGSIQLCFCPLLGCISGPLFDAGYLKHLIVVGGSIYVFCMMMTSIATEYWQILLAHGIGVGIGMGLIFSPSVGTLSHHFAKSRYRTLAYGCQASGSAVAGVIVPIMLRFLFPAVGFGWGMRIRKSEHERSEAEYLVGFLVLALVVTAFFTLSRTHPPRKKIAVLSPAVCESL